MKIILWSFSALFIAASLHPGHLSAASENVHGTFYQVAPNFTLYGQVHDANDNTNVYQYQVCWDDPTFTHNCEPYLQANGYAALPLATAPPVCVGVCRGIQYAIPAGTPAGWTITPRDGNDHLIYGRIVSQYGNPPTPVDGSPMPFRVITGNVDRTVTVETNPTRLQPAQLAVLANDRNTYSIGSIGNPVCNGSGPATGNGSVIVRDDGVVGYYVKKWNVPCANVFIVSYTVPIVTYSGGVIGTHTGLSPTMSEGVFNSAILPVLNLIPASLQAIAIGWADSGTVTPSSTVGPGNLVRGLTSMTAAIATKSIPAGTACVDPHPGLMGYGPANPYYNSNSKTPYTDFGIRPTMFLAAEACQNCVGTVFGNGFVLGPWDPDAPSMMRVIDAAFSGRDTNPANAKAYWAYSGAAASEYISANGVGSASVPNSYFGYMNRLSNTLAFGSPALPATNTTVGAADPVYGVPDRILLYSNTSPSYNYLNPDTLPGASVGWANRSTVGSIPYDNNQTPIATWLNNGFVAGYGTAVEPCENITSKYPHGDIFLKNYTQGQTVIEALWKSIEQIYAGNSTGDPLAAPFSLPISANSVSPASGSVGATVNVTLNGSGFTPGAGVTVSGSGVTASNVSVVNANLLTAALTIGAGASTGVHNISVTGVSSTFPFSVSASPLPVVSSLSPAFGAQGTSANVMLTGSNFVSGATIAVTGAGLVASNVAVLSNTQIAATLTSATNASAAAIYTVSVVTPAGRSGAVIFDVTPAGTTSPALTSISPSSGTKGTVLPVTLTGTNFVSGSAISFGGVGVSAASVVVVSPTRITALFTLNANASPGARNISVVSPNGTTNGLPFTVTGSGPALNSLSPALGAPGASVNVTLSGANFIAGSKVTVSGSGVTVSNSVIVNPTTITAIFHVAGNATPGAYNVIVTTTAGASSAQPFTVSAPPPVLTALTPNGGLQGATLRVALLGSNFVPGATIRISGSGVTISNVTFFSANQINITLTIGSAAAQLYSVSVSTNSGTSGSLSFRVSP